MYVCIYVDNYYSYYFSSGVNVLEVIASQLVTYGIISFLQAALTVVIGIYAVDVSSYVYHIKLTCDRMWPGINRAYGHKAHLGLFILYIRNLQLFLYMVSKICNCGMFQSHW